MNIRQYQKNKYMEGIKMFYVVHSEIDDHYAQAEYSLQEFVEYTCEKCQAIYRSDRIGAYRVHFIDGELLDFYNAPGCYLGNDFVINMLEKYKLTGYELREIECTGWYDKFGEMQHLTDVELKEIFILGRCGAMCDAEGFEIEKCSVCGMVALSTKMRIRGLSVPVETCDGSDVFSFDNWPGVMIATQRFKDACEKEQIKGITFQDVNKFCFMPGIKI